MRPSFTNHTSTAFTALDYLLEQDETLELSLIHVVGQLSLPLLVSRLDDLSEGLVESGVVVLLDNQENVVKLMAQLIGLVQSLPELAEVGPVLLLPEELNPHFMGSRRLVMQIAVVSVAQ